MPMEKTENYLRFRQNDPDQYEYFRTSDEWKDNGRTIKAVYGVKSGKSEVQSLLFERGEWTMDEAKGWIGDHEKFHASGESGVLILLVFVGYLIYEKFFR